MFLTIADSVNELAVLFPSPSGALMFLTGNDVGIGLAGSVSVPFRGFDVSNGGNKMLKVRSNNVSVPFRGFDVSNYSRYHCT